MLHGRKVHLTSVLDQDEAWQVANHLSQQLCYLSYSRSSVTAHANSINPVVYRVVGRKVWSSAASITSPRTTVISLALQRYVQLELGPNTTPFTMLAVLQHLRLWIYLFSLDKSAAQSTYRVIITFILQHFPEFLNFLGYTHLGSVVNNPHKRREILKSLLLGRSPLTSLYSACRVHGVVLGRFAMKKSL